jgi:hypothetical protein
VGERLPGQLLLLRDGLWFYNPTGRWFRAREVYWAQGRLVWRTSEGGHDWPSDGQDGDFSWSDVQFSLTVVPEGEYPETPDGLRWIRWDAKPIPKLFVEVQNVGGRDAFFIG